MGWRQYVGDGGAVIGISTFGASAPGGTVMTKLGLTPDNIIEKAMDLLKK
jgi:transketolase